MLLSAAFAALSLSASAALARQFPEFDGVVGAVPSSPAVNPKSAVDDLLAQQRPKTTPGHLRGVVENSGICETTPGVYQASGYGDIAANKSIWFWFFEARNNPETAPLVAWFNGGPGSSSMIGLFQELGPCRIQNDSTTVEPNPNSYTDFTNVIFVDQPVGVGFSYGTEEVGTSQAAAEDVWTFFQIWFNDSRFSKYKQRNFGIWTESYGGHYGPTFAAHFLRQNAAIDRGAVKGTKINLGYLAIGDGLTDPLLQYPGFITYAKTNRYHPLVNDSVLEAGKTAFYSSGGCRDQIAACYKTSEDKICSAAQGFCNGNVLDPLAGDWDVYYVLTPNPDPYPPDMTPYLTNSTITSAIGAQSTFQFTNFDVYSNFAATGDWMHNSRPLLEEVINAGVRTHVFDGDADYILNFYGVEAMVDALQTKFAATYARQDFANYTVNGVPAGIFKNAGTFSYLRVFGAGHEVPAYEWPGVPRGAAALQMFTQVMSNKPLSGT
ncbi:serine carboxypeptidase [Vararia minispora EC-137]|uniref:Serine carboxypeptidase n=1 Tax=Vararia minispora EC-137 TaxID=1314806 RepID=A0ACB8QYA4_9AGAM|nr:serine carboxypeptidase [Vararia minispora EC-137]